MQTLFRVVHALFASALVIAVSTGCSAKSKRDRHLQRADNYFDANQYSKAEIEYLNALRYDPAHAHTFARLGTIYYEQGRHSRAYPFLGRASELNTNDLSLRLKLGHLYCATGKAAEARNEASFILERVPTNAEAPLLLVESVTSSNDLRLVRQRLDQLAARVGETAPLQLASGMLQIRQGNLPEAESALKRALSLDPKSAAAHVARGALYVARNDLTNADLAFKTAADLSPPRSVRRLKYADFKIATGQLGEAKQLLAEITHQTPDYLPALIRQADLAFAEKDFTQCGALVNQALALDSISHEALLLKGRCLLAQNNADQAIVEFERLTTLYDSSAPAYYHLALASLVKDDPARAIRNLNRAVSLGTNYVDAILLLAQLNNRQGNSAAAIASLTQLVRQQPQLFQGHVLLADAFLGQRRFDEAVATYRRMQVLFPKNPQIPLFLGAVFTAQNKMTEARQAFQQSQDLAPDSISPLERLVDLDLLDKRYGDAMERVRKRMAKNAQEAQPWLLVAKIHLAQNAADAAEEALHKAIELDPDLRMPYLLLARIHVTANRHQQALERLNGLVAKATNDVAALMQIALIHDTLTNYPAARDTYRRLLAVNPRFSPALNNLAYLYSEHLGQLDEAQRLAEEARRLLPKDPSLADTLGWIYFRKGDYLRALGLLQESAERLPLEPEVQLHLGMTHYMLGEEQPARVALEFAIQSPRDFPGKDEGRRCLNWLALDVRTADASVRADLEKRRRDQPRDPVAGARLAAIYERDGEFRKAADIYEQVIKHSPQNFRIMGRLAELYANRLNEPQKALTLAKDAHTRAPEDPSTARTLGRLLYQQGDHQWALNLLLRVAQQFPDQPDVQYDLAWAQYSMGRVAEAEAAMQRTRQAGSQFAALDDATRFLAMIAAMKNPTTIGQSAAQAEKILAAEPNYLPALMVSALLQEQQGKPEQAIRLYEKALAAFPLFSPAARNLALIIAQRPGETQRAYDLILKARAAFPDDPEVKRALGILLYQRGEFVRALPLLEESALRWDRDGTVRYYQGMACYRLKRLPECKTALQQALNLNLPTALAEDARKVLAEIK